LVYVIGITDLRVFQVASFVASDNAIVLPDHQLYLDRLQWPPHPPPVLSTSAEWQRASSRCIN